MVCSLLGLFTSHVVGCEAIGILVNSDLSLKLKRRKPVHPAKLSLVVDIMNEETIETRMNCAKLIEMLLLELEGNEIIIEIVSILSLLVGLLRLVRDKKHPNWMLIVTPQFPDLKISLK